MTYERESFLELKFLKEALEVAKKHRQLSSRGASSLKGRISDIREKIRIFNQSENSFEIPDWLFAFLKGRDFAGVFGVRGLSRVEWIKGTIKFRFVNCFESGFIYYPNKNLVKLEELGFSKIRNYSVVSAEELFPKECPNGITCFKVSLIDFSLSFYSIRQEEKFLAIRNGHFSLTNKLEASIKKVDINITNHVVRKLKNGN